MGSVLMFAILFFSSIGYAWSQAGYRIESFESNKIIVATGDGQGLKVGQVLAIESQFPEAGIIGYTRIISIESLSTQAESTQNRIRAELIRVSQYNFARIGDSLVSFDLSTHMNGYKGSTELLVRENAPLVSSRFKPLFTQGVVIGETAQTLWRNEFLITWYGLLHYGLADWISIGTLVPGNVLKTPNASAKVRFLNSGSDTVSTGLTFTKIRDTERWSLNWNLMWDSFSKENSVSHTFATIAIYSIEKAEDTTAIKSAGTSAIQTGHEFILNNWSRVLFGPNYNVETKAVGGYLAYVSIWDNFHLQGSLYSTNVRNLEWSTSDGYFAYIDAYWRF